MLLWDSRDTHIKNPFICKSTEVLRRRSDRPVRCPRLLDILQQVRKMEALLQVHARGGQEVHRVLPARMHTQKPPQAHTRPCALSTKCEQRKNVLHLYTSWKHRMYRMCSVRTRDGVCSMRFISIIVCNTSRIMHGHLKFNYHIYIHHKI